MQNRFTPKEEEQFKEVLKKYPEQQEPFVEAFKKMNIGMEDLLKRLESKDYKTRKGD